jgi:hypothetical protein
MGARDQHRLTHRANSPCPASKLKDAGRAIGLWITLDLKRVRNYFDEGGEKN